MENNYSQLNKDLQIQDCLDNAKEGNIIDNADSRLYRELYNALKKEPPVSLPYGFSGYVERLVLLRKRRSQRKLLYGLLFMIAFVLIASTAFMWNNYDLSILIDTYKWPLTFGSATLVVIHALEYSTLRKKWLQKEQ